MSAARLIVVDDTPALGLQPEESGPNYLLTRVSAALRIAAISEHSHDTATRVASLHAVIQNVTIDFVHVLQEACVRLQRLLDAFEVQYLMLRLEYLVVDTGVCRALDATLEALRTQLADLEAQKEAQWDLTGLRGADHE